MSGARNIETGRLVLTPYSETDFRDLVTLWGDERVTRYIFGAPRSEEQTWAQLLRSIGHWSVMNYGFWTVRDRSSGRFIGEVGFSDHRRSIQPSLGHAPEMGWVISPDAQGQGYAREASHAAIDWADRELKRRLVCMVHPENIASLRVARGCGFAEFAATDYQGSPVILLERGGP